MAVTLNDKGISEFCTMIEHATNRLSGKLDIDTDAIADRLEACAAAVRSGKRIHPGSETVKKRDEPVEKKTVNRTGAKKKRRKRSV